MIASEVTTVQSTTQTYTTAAPDTSNIVAFIVDGVASITYGGSTLTIPIDAIPALTALVATVGAAIPPIPAPVVAPAAPGAPPATSPTPTP